MRAVGRTLLSGRGGMTLSGTIEEGIELLLERRSEVTPPFETIAGDVRDLYVNLGLPQPALQKESA
jgi:hypothetical protein